MNIVPVNFKIDSSYVLEAVRPDGSTIREKSGVSDNLITTVGKNNFLSFINTGATSSYGNIAPGLVVGVGNVEPSIADTGLTSFKAGQSFTAGFQAGTSTITNDDNYVYCLYTVRIRFAQGAAAGNISEIGCVWATSAAGVVPTAASQISSHALVLDGSGNPTTVTVLTDEYLDVTWSLRISFPRNVSMSFPQSIKGVATTQTCLIKAMAMTKQSKSGVGFSLTYNSGNLTINDGFSFPATPATDAVVWRSVGEPDSLSTAPPTGSVSGGAASSYALATYVAGSFYRDVTYTWGLNTGNISGINCFAINFGLGSVFIYFNDGNSFTKANTDSLSVTVRFSLGS